MYRGYVSTLYCVKYESVHVRVSVNYVGASGDVVPFLRDCEAPKCKQVCGSERVFVLHSLTEQTRRGHVCPSFTGACVELLIRSSHNSISRSLFFQHS